jgi:hypothetical protein
MMPLLHGMVVLAAVLANCVESDTPLCLALPEGATSVRICSHFLPVFSLFTPAGVAVAFLFAVNATTVGLPVQSECFRDPDPFRPALTEIPVEKGNVMLPGHRLTNAPDEIVLLKAAVKKGSRKGVETPVFRDLRSPYEPQTVAMPAAILLTECDLSQEPFQGVTLLPHHSEPLLTGIDSERIEALFVFQIGMDIRIVKVAADLMTLFF